MLIPHRKLVTNALALALGPLALAMTGCASTGGMHGIPGCGPCNQPVHSSCDVGCSPAPACNAPVQACDTGCDAGCAQTECCDQGCNKCCGFFTGLFARRSNAIPDVLPLGSTVRAHYEQMQTNAEAVDFVINDVEFVRESAALTPNGRDHILEIAARMPSSPFPVIVERTKNNADPELDAIRRELVVQVLSDLGSPDANSRVFIATPYGPGFTGREAERTYYRHIFQGGIGGNNFGNGGFGGGGFGGGFGGGGFGGGGF